VSLLIGAPINFDLVLQQPNGTTIIAGECTCRSCGKDIDPHGKHAFECSHTTVKGARTIQSSAVKSAIKSSADDPIRQQIVIAIFRGNAILFERFATHCYLRYQQVRAASEESVL